MISDAAVQDLEMRIAQLEDTVRFMAEIMSDRPTNDMRDIVLAIVAKGFPVSNQVHLPTGRRAERCPACLEPLRKDGSCWNVLAHTSAERTNAPA